MSQDNVIPMVRAGETVKPCPFCGAEADYSDVEWTDDEQCCFVVCGGCLAEGPSVCMPCHDDLENEELERQAIDFWNQRA